MNLGRLVSHQILDLGDVSLQSGTRLRDAKLAFATLGALNRARDNAVVMPTYYTGQHNSYSPLIGPGMPLDPTRYFIIIPNMFGNGLSSSPSTHPEMSRRGEFPRISLYDNVVQQGKLVFDHLKVSEVALVCGWSLGGMQAFQWGCLYPERVCRLLPFCASAKASSYNQVFLKGLSAALSADDNWRDDYCSSAPEKGLRAFARVYAGWAYSEEFFRRALYRDLGYQSLEGLLVSWEREHLAFNANDLMTMLDTWMAADIGANQQCGGNTESALRAIQARTVLLPCSTDRYFCPTSNYEEAAFIKSCEVRLLESPFGHCALSPGKHVHCMQFLNRCLGELLDR